MMKPPWWVRATRPFGDFGRGSTNRRMLDAAVLVGIATLLVKALSAGKELVVAYRLGTSAELDAFLFAYMFPLLMVGVLSGALQSAFVPRYLGAVRECGQSDADQMAASFSTLLSVVLLAASFIFIPIGLTLIPGLARGFTPAAVEMARHYLWLLAPVIFLNGLAGFWVGVLNSRERFLPAAMAGAITPVVLMLFLLVGWTTLGSKTLVVGTVVGGVLELLLVLALVSRMGAPIFASRLSWNGEQRAVIGQFLPAAAGSLLMGGTLVVDQTMASWLEPGSVAALGYGTRLTLVLVSVTTMALGTAALPFFSRMVAEGDVDGIRATLRSYTRLIVMAAIPMVVLLVLLSPWLIKLLFERGAFTSTDTRTVALVQSLYALQIPFITWGILAVRLISSLKANNALLWGSIISLALNCVLNLLLSRWLGVAGIALSTSIVYMASCVFFAFVIRRRLATLQAAGC